MSNKKGSADLGIIIVIIFLIGISLISYKYIANSVVDGFQEEIDATLYPQTNATLQDYEDHVNTMMDPLVLASFLGMLLAFWVGAFVVDTHPVFTMVAVLSMIISVIIAVPFSNAGQTYFASLGYTSAHIPMTIFIFEHLPLLIAVGGAIQIIIMYGKLRAGGI